VREVKKVVELSINPPNLKEIRASLGISQMKLAAKVGVSLLTLQLWEHGISSPNTENRVKLESVIKELARA
jgi:DNA-binding transcriptional regulator YiaG